MREAHKKQPQVKIFGFRYDRRNGTLISALHSANLPKLSQCLASAGAGSSDGGGSDYECAASAADGAYTLNWNQKEKRGILSE